MRVTTAATTLAAMDTTATAAGCSSFVDGNEAPASSSPPQQQPQSPQLHSTPEDGPRCRSRALADRLIYLNTRAITSLWEGEEDLALSLLKQGLIEARDDLQPPTTTTTPTTTSTTPVAQGPSPNYHRRRRRLSLTALELTGVLHPEYQQSHYRASDDNNNHDMMGASSSSSSLSSPPSPWPHGFLYYAHVFLLEEEDEDERGQESAPNEQDDDEDDDDSNSTTFWSVARLCALLAYNLAVIGHENGLARGRLPTLGQAARLYRYALHSWRMTIAGPAGTTTQAALPVQQQVDNNGDNGNDDQDELLFAMALYNNVGHVAAFMDDAITVQVAREGLEFTLRRALASTATDSKVSTTATTSIRHCEDGSSNHHELGQQQSQDFRMTMMQDDNYENPAATSTTTTNDDEIMTEAYAYDYDTWWLGGVLSAAAAWQACLKFFSKSLVQAQHLFLVPCASAA